MNCDKLKLMFWLLDYQVRHTSPALRKSPSSSPRQATKPPDMAWIRRKTRQSSLPGTHSMEKILPHLHSPRQIRSQLVKSRARRRCLHCHWSSTPRKKTRFQKRVASQAVVFQGLRQLHSSVKLDAMCFRKPFHEIGFLLVDKHFDNWKRWEDKTSAGDCGFRGLPDRASSACADAEAVEVCGYVAVVQRAVG